MIDHVHFLVLEKMEKEKFNVMHCGNAQVLSTRNTGTVQNEYLWDNDEIHLIELSVAILQNKAVRMTTGEPVNMNHFIHAFSNFLGIEIIRIYNKIQKIRERKKSNTPFLDKLTIALGSFSKS